eukprot:13603500-Alexandrium_andersonii.AAC.1
MGGTFGGRLVSLRGLPALPFAHAFGEGGGGSLGGAGLSFGSPANGGARRAGGAVLGSTPARVRLSRDP